MRVLIDLLYIVNDKPSGIKKYGFKLATDILKYTGGNEVGILCTDDMLEHIESEIGKHFNYIVVSNKEKRILGRDYSVYRKTNAEKTRAIESYDFVISTWANYPVALFSPYIKHVGVIHDLQMLKLMRKGRNFIRTIYYYFDAKKRIKKLDYIVTISEQTHSAVKKFAKKESIIIYNSVAPPTIVENKPQDFPFGENEKYILDINTFNRYKNADLLLEAFSYIHKEYPSFRLYFKGNYTGEYNRLPQLAEKLGISDKVFFDLIKLTENEIGWLYSNAALFVSPSLMEGFGYTPIEAITHRTPVIVSEIDTLKEVVKDCGVYFNPNNAEELALRIRDEICNPTPQEELARRQNVMLELYSGKKQVNCFMDYLYSLYGK